MGISSLSGARVVPQPLLLVGHGPWGQNLLRTILARRDCELRGLVTSQPVVWDSWLSKSLSSIEQTSANLGEPPIFSTLAAANGLKAATIIASAAEVHAEQILERLSTTRLPLFVEKPLCLNSQDLDRILQTQKATLAPILVDHILLFHPAYQALVTYLEQNQDQLLGLESCGGGPGPLRASYGALWDYGSHDVALHLDLLRRLCSPSAGAQLTLPNRIDCQRGPQGEYQVEMTFGQLSTRFVVCNSWPQKCRWLKVITERGVYEFHDRPSVKLEFYSRQREAPQNLTFRDRSPLNCVLDEFLKPETQRISSLWDLHLAAASVRILESIEPNKSSLN